MTTKYIGCNSTPAANRFVTGANVREEIKFNTTILIQDYSICARCFDEMIEQLHIKRDTRIHKDVKNVYIDDRLYDMPTSIGDV